MKDAVSLDWKRVKALRSQDAFIVDLSTGERLTGLLQKSAAPNDDGKDFKIETSGSTMELNPSDVVSIAQKEGVVWNQLTGSISYGFDFASGNNALNSSLGADVGYRGTKNSMQVTTSSQFNSQTNADATNRFTFDSQYVRMLSTNWLAVGLYSVLKSNQQDLQLRSTYGGGVGRRLFRTDRTSVTVIGGAAYSHESYVPQLGVEPVLNNAESLLGITFSTFRFKTLDLASQNFLFPSISDPGRVRLSSQSRLRIELVRNFYWSLQLYENYDTRPPVTAPKNDLGVTTSLGWTF
jgi:putative salt-induced outer membrane protein YdiY